MFSPKEGKCGKNADENNSEYGHFLRSAVYQFLAFVELGKYFRFRLFF